MSDTETLKLLTAEITANFVANNSVAVSDIGELISSVYDALAKVEAPEAAPEKAEEFVGATTVRKSLADPAKIISMIDGKPYSMLKRHLSQHGLTPEDYRNRYKLPSNYPMTAPAYSEQRKALAVKIGLGRKSPASEAPTMPVAEPVAPAKPRRKLGISAEGVTNTAPAAAPKSRRLSGKAALAKVRATAE